MNRPSDFKRVYSKGNKLVCGSSIFHFIKNNSGDTRLGISVKKSCGNSVVRSRVKRVIKSFFLKFYPIGFDVFVIFKKKSGKDFSSSEFLEDFKSFLFKSGELV